jgi:hypothetical protein
MIPARLAHCSPGRLRLRVRSKRGDAAYFGRVRDHLSQCPGVRQLQVNPVTGSVVVHHSLPLEGLLGFGKANGLFEIEETPVGGPPPLARVSDAFAGLSQRLERATAGGLDLATLAFAALTGAALVQLARGNAGAPAVTLLWYAATVVLLATPRGGSEG